MNEVLGLTELKQLFSNDVTPMPRFVVMNLAATDATGHAFAPHGDMVDTVVEHVDAELGTTLGWLDEWGIADRTTLILTSDHGMELADPTRSGDPRDTLRRAGIEFVDGSWLGIYLK